MLLKKQRQKKRISEDKITFKEAEKILEKINNWEKRKKEFMSTYETYEGSIQNIESSIAKLSGNDTEGGYFESYFLRLSYQNRSIGSFEYSYLPAKFRKGNSKIKTLYEDTKQIYFDSRSENIKFRKELSDIVNKLTK